MLTLTDWPPLALPALLHAAANSNSAAVTDVTPTTLQASMP
jgi:hypothetical protein